MRRLRLALPLLALAGCVTTVAPKRAPVAEGSPITFYPKACEERGGVKGDLQLSGANRLDELGDPVCITGSLIVEASGVEQLRFARLSEVGGDVIIRDNGKLTRVELPLLRLVGGAVLLLNLPALTSADLPELTVVGDHVIFGRHRDLDAALSEDSPGSALVQVTLPALRAVGGAVVFRTNPKLERFTLPALQRVGDGLLIENNRKLSGFELAASAKVHRTILLDDNDSLESLAGLGPLTEVPGDLVVINHEEVKDLAPLANLRAVQGSLRISHNRLNTFELPALETVGGTIEVLDQVAITALALPKLRSVGDRFEIHGNNSLADVTLPALTSVGGNLDISANFALATLALPALTTLGGDLGFVDNANLSVLGAPQVAEIADNLVVEANAVLKGLDFPKLTKIHGYLTVQDNPQLESFDGLAQVTKIGVKLYVKDNPALPDCAATKLRDQLAPERPMWGEEIGNNRPDSACK